MQTIMNQQIRQKTSRLEHSKSTPTSLCKLKIPVLEEEDTDPGSINSFIPVNCLKSSDVAGMSQRNSRISSLSSFNSQKRNLSQVEQLADLVETISYLNKRLIRTEEFNEDTLNENAKLRQQIESLQIFNEDSESSQGKIKNCFDCTEFCKIV